MLNFVSLCCEPALNCCRSGEKFKVMLVFTAAISVALAHGQMLNAQTFNTMVNSGDSANRVDMIFIGDGYTAGQHETVFVDHINATLGHFFGSGGNPLPRYQNFFNVHRVNVISNEQGADDPNEGIFVDTALDASYNVGGIDRCLYFDTGLANTAVNTALSGTGIDIDMRLGSVNSNKYGGCGGQWGVYAGGHGAAPEIALHEIGHSFARLADEYVTNNSEYPGNEPSQVNITTDNGPDGKWQRWVGYDDPDSDIGEIGYFEGGGYYATGIYRPSEISKMRALNRPFDAISRERLIDEIYEEVDPLDDWLANDETLFDPDMLWVETVDPSVINVEWLVDGVSLGNLGEILNVGNLDLSEGLHTIEARAYDGILDFSFTGQTFDWWRLPDSSALRQNISWTVQAVPEPGSVALIVLLFSIGGVRRRNRS